MKISKEKILSVSLDLFAKRGYEGVSVSDIAGTLGVAKSAIYKHFSSKKDVLEGILLKMERDDALRAERFCVPSDTYEGNASEYSNVSYRNFIEFCKAQFLYWTEEKFPSDFRKMLSLEKHSDPRMAELYRNYICTGPLEYTKDIIKNNKKECYDAELSALALYAPIFMLYSLYDESNDKNSVMRLANRFFENLEKEILNNEVSEK